MASAFDFQSEWTFVTAFLMPKHVWRANTELQWDGKSLFNFSQKESQGKNIWKHEVVVTDRHSILRLPLNHKGNQRAARPAPMPDSDIALLCLHIVYRVYMTFDICAVLAH